MLSDWTVTQSLYHQGTGLPILPCSLSYFPTNLLYNNTVQWLKSEGHKSWGIVCPFKCTLTILISPLSDNAWHFLSRTEVLVDQFELLKCKMYPGPSCGDDRLSEIAPLPPVNTSWGILRYPRFWGYMIFPVCYGSSQDLLECLHRKASKAAS